jgi:hypothetical protein
MYRETVEAREVGNGMLSGIYIRSVLLDSFTMRNKPGRGK